MQDDRLDLFQQKVQKRRYSGEGFRSSIDACKINISLLKALSFDLDGTLFRKGLDDIFWNERIPSLLANKEGIPFNEAQRFLFDEYKKIGESDPRWYIPEYWFNRLDLDVPVQDVLSSVNYRDGIYEDANLLHEFAKDYSIIICTNNARSMLSHKIKLMDSANCISHTFSSVSDFKETVKNRHFYRQVCTHLAVRPDQVLHIGDDPIHDFEEPHAEGVNAILIDREGKSNTIHTLHDLHAILNG
ncbi:MAG: HAD family hydrolase [Nitrososphaerales archaeon]